MEVALKAVITLSVTINCNYNTAFDYLSVPTNQKEWGIHFFQDIEKIGDQYIATVPFGKLPMVIKSNRETGILDIYLNDGNPIRTRLIQIEENISVYNFTLVQPKNMSKEEWDTIALPNMKDELNILKSILENK